MSLASDLRIARLVNAFVAELNDGTPALESGSESERRIALEIAISVWNR